jgi:hypothetical protein
VVTNRLDFVFLNPLVCFSKTFLYDGAQEFDAVLQPLRDIGKQLDEKSEMSN